MPKILEIIAGPNGSGKTTFAETGLIKKEKIFSINSDTIARGLTPNGNPQANFAAGRFMIQAIETALKSKKSFSFETTFSGKIWSWHIRRAKEAGYRIIIYFIFVRSVELSLKRIKYRVKHGGHDVPEKIVRRRFYRTFHNFKSTYMSLADEWYVIDNSNKPIVIAQKKNQDIKIIDKNIFNRFFR